MAKPLIDALNEIKSLENYSDDMIFILLQKDIIYDGSRTAFVGKLDELLTPNNENDLNKLSYINNDAFKVNNETVVMINVGIL